RCQPSRTGRDRFTHERRARGRACQLDGANGGLSWRWAAPQFGASRSDTIVGAAIADDLDTGAVDFGRQPTPHGGPRVVPRPTQLMWCLQCPLLGASAKSRVADPGVYFDGLVEIDMHHTLTYRTMVARAILTVKFLSCSIGDIRQAYR